MCKFLWLLMLYAGGATAAPLPSLPPCEHAATLFGTATVTRFGITVYDATLWTDAALWSMATPFMLTLDYHLNLSGSQLVGKSLELMKENEALTEEENDRYKKLMAGVFPDVQDGDRISACYIPNAQIIFYHNGKKTGEIEDSVFTKRFFDLWLGASTSEPEARKTLLNL